MKVAILSDIHSNLIALEAVFKDMPTVDAVLCAGDVIGYYADPNQVCQIIRQKGAMVIRGNHDAFVIDELAFDTTKERAYRVNWTRNVLKEENLSWLKTLPIELKLEYGKFKVILRHASPWDESTYLYPNSPALSKIMLRKDTILITGHTHHPLVKRIGDGLLINPGSVGQPRDWNPKASYAILDTETSEVSINRATYNVALVQKQLNEIGCDKEMIEILNRTR